MIALGSDHGGFELKAKIIEHLDALGIKTVDCGTNSAESVDYPVYAGKVAKLIQNGECELGILICSTGVGISIAANKYRGIRCALCGNTYAARYTRMHNNANVLALGALVTAPGLAMDIVDAFLNAEFEGGRHQRRVSQIEQIEIEESQR